MTVEQLARPRVETTRRATISALARVEAGRMLRHPAPWIGLVLSLLMARDTMNETWQSAGYGGLVSAASALFIGISLASISVFGRERVALVEEAPLPPVHRSIARLLGGLSMVALTALVVVAAEAWLRVRGGLPLGEEPGRVVNAHYSLPELLQPVLLAGFAVVLGAALVHVVRHRLTASILAFVVWFLTGVSYWIFNSGSARWMTPVQVQPVFVVAGPTSADPEVFPSDWLLSIPGEFQDYWARIVVSPWLASWHDVYLLGLILLAASVALGWRHGKRLAIAGFVVLVLAVPLQRAATPTVDAAVTAAAVSSAATPTPGGLPPAPAKNPDAVPVLVDTDLGGDDLVALSFLLRHPDVDVRAVTIAATGLVGCDPGTTLLADLFVALREQPVPIACGRATAGAGARTLPQAWRKAAATGSGIPHSGIRLPLAAAGAAELIAGTARGTDGLVVVALGPLTNLAEVAGTAPDAYARLAGVHAMAGSVEGPLVEGAAEWNAAADPASFTTVLASDVPLVIVPEDAIPAGTPSALSAPVVGPVAASVYYPKWWDLATAAALVSPDSLQLESGEWVLDPAVPGRLHSVGPGSVQVARTVDATPLDAAYADAFSGRD